VPTIPLYYHQPQVPSARGVRASPNMMGVQDAARAQLQESVQGLQNDLQEAKDYRTKKELELARNEAWGQFQNSLQERGEEEKWVEQWEKQSAEVAKPFLQTKGLSLKAKREFEFEQKAWEQQTRLGVQNLATQRGIAVSKQVATAAADSAWDNGDEEGATKVYAEMVERKLLDARLVPQMVEKGRARMQGVALSRELDVAATLPPAQGYVALEDLRERLQAKAQGLDALPDRERLARLGQVEKGQRSLQRGMLEEAREILKGIEKGELGVEALGAAVESGAIDEVIATALGWSPEEEEPQKQFGGAIAGALAKQKEKVAEAQLKEDRAHAAKLEGLMSKIYPSGTSGGTLGMADIDQARKLGFIEEEEYEKLKAAIAGQLYLEQHGHVYRSEMAKIGGLVNRDVKNWGFWAKAGLVLATHGLATEAVVNGFSYGVDSSPSEWRRRVEAVGKLPLSKQGRIEVAKALLAVRIKDLMDGEEGVDDSLFDRRVSKQELEVRREISNELKKHADTLGPMLTLQLFLSLEDVVRADFDEYKGNPPAEVVDGLKGNVKGQIQNAASGRVLNELYGLFSNGAGGPVNFNFADRAGSAAPTQKPESVDKSRFSSSAVVQEPDEEGYVDLGGYNPREGAE